MDTPNDLPDVGDVAHWMMLACSTDEDYRPTDNEEQS
jgi:hypothetical protein